MYELVDYKVGEFQNPPNMGDLYNCDKTRMFGIKSPLKARKCGVKKPDAKQYKARVYKYQKVTKYIDLYLCKATAYVLKCKENILGLKDRTFAETSLDMSPDECKSAAIHKSPILGMEL